MLDAQQKIEGVSSAQTKVLPLANRLTSLQAQLDKAGESFKGVLQDEAVIKEQQARLVELVESGRVAGDRDRGADEADAGARRRARPLERPSRTS